MGGGGGGAKYDKNNEKIYFLTSAGQVISTSWCHNSCPLQPTISPEIEINLGEFLGKLPVGN
jgi:hypothetical protein